MTSLQNFVSQLRKHLGPEVLVTKAPGYMLRVDALQVDVNRVKTLLAEARQSPPDERAKKLREAIDMWRGPPLEEFVIGLPTAPARLALDEPIEVRVAG